MNAKQIVTELQEKYPGKTIIQIPPKNPTEVICEIKPTSEYPGQSRAIAIIDESIPHFHIKTTEKYTVLKGALILTAEGKDHHIPEGQSYIIRPMQHHSAKGDSTWAEVVSTPGWTPDDHIIKE